MKKLKKILGKLNPSKDAIFMGYALKWHQSVWMSGGAGYVVSSKAFQEMITFLKAKEDEFLTLKVKSTLTENECHTLSLESPM